MRQLNRLIMYIGIVDGSQKSIKELINMDRYAFFNRSYRNYGWRFEVYRETASQSIKQRSHSLQYDKHERRSNARVFKTEDNEVNMVRLILDVPNKSLMVVVNDESNSLSPINKFENVDISGLYRMALSMRHPGVKIEIIDFQITQK